MKLVQVEILGMVTTTRFGTLTTGQNYWFGEDFAKHLVDDCGAAKYVDATASGNDAQEGEVVKPKSPKAKKQNGPVPEIPAAENPAAENPAAE